MIGTLALAAAAAAEPAPTVAPTPPVPPTTVAPSILPALVAATGARPADCLLQLAEVTVTLAAQQPGAAKPVTVTRDAGRLVEHVRYDDGRELRVVHSGCAHYGVVWEIAAVVGGPDLVATARSAFAGARTVGGDPPMPIDFLSRWVPGPDGTFACGDAYCTLEFDGRVLRFAYDFPM